ncbi:MAG: fumarylacetoacetate hydrolase family protein [Chloroflexi bacterium]|nr:fumarylacetoacetate hydrolase family protein [Chloroflexota bacterium]
MRLVTFRHRDETHIGALITHDERRAVFDFNAAQPHLPDEMIAFLKLGVLPSVHERYFIPESDVTLLAPVPRPGKIICVGHNYHGHTGATPPAYPDIFAKFANVVIGPHQPIVCPRVPVNLDYEGELAVVIGKRARYVPEDRALEYVAGYTIFNDVTARDYQNRTSQWTLGKSFDTFGPMGPVLVTADEIPDPGHLELSLTVNGEERQRSNTCNLIFSIPFLISYLSQAITLEPGDVISTGTPSGTGASLKPPVFMQPGDVVSVRIEKIGELINIVTCDG